MHTTEAKVSTDPAIDQNSLTLGFFLDREIRMVVIRTIRIGMSGLALSIIIC